MWDEAVLGTHDFQQGESVEFDEPRLRMPRPDGVSPSAIPFRAHARGWDLCTEGVLAGRAWVGGAPHGLGDLRGQRLERAGDRCLLWYGSTALYSEVVRLPPRPPGMVVDSVLLAAALYSLVFVVGGLWLVWAVTGPRVQDPPNALLDPQRIARIYYAPEQAGPTTAGLAPPTSEKTRLISRRTTLEPDRSPSPRDPDGAVLRALALEQPEPMASDPRDVVGTVLEHQAEADRCFAGQPVLDSIEGARVTLRWVVASTGRAESVTVVSAFPPMPAVEQCLLRHVAALTFAARECATTVVHTYRSGLL